MDVDVLDEIWCCFPHAHSGEICATVEGVGSRTSTLATKRFPRVALLHQDRPTVSDGNHLCDEASSQEKRRPHQEAASHEHRRELEVRPQATLQANTALWVACFLVRMGVRQRTPHYC